MNDDNIKYDVIDNKNTNNNTYRNEIKTDFPEYDLGFICDESLNVDDYALLNKIIKSFGGTEVKLNQNKFCELVELAKNHVYPSESLFRLAMNFTGGPINFELI